MNCAFYNSFIELAYFVPQKYLVVANISIYALRFLIIFNKLNLAVCCGVRGRALASHTDVRGFETQCGGRLSSLTC